MTTPHDRVSLASATHAVGSGAVSALKLQGLGGSSFQVGGS